MPTKVMQNYAKEAKKPIEQVEKDWTYCKHLANGKFKTKDGHYWAFVNSCTQRRLGIEHKYKHKKQDKPAISKW